MTCLTEQILEHAVLAELSRQPEDPQVAEHLHSCQFCSERYRYLTRFYRDFDNSLRQPLTVSEEAWLDYLMQGRRAVIILKFLPTTQQELEPYSSILSAETEAQLPQQLVRNLGVLASEDQDVIIRLLRHLESRELYLHLIAEDKAKYQHVLINIEGFADTYVTDEWGQVKLGMVNIPDPEQLQIAVTTAVSAFTVTREQFEACLTRSKTELILKNHEDDSIMIEVLPSGERHVLWIHLLRVKGVDAPSSLKVLVGYAGQRNLITRMDYNIAVVPNITASGEVQIKIFP
jgi:hypothetical protein